MVGGKSASLCYPRYTVVLASVLFSIGPALLKQTHFALSPAPPAPLLPQFQYALLGPGAATIDRMFQVPVVPSHTMISSSMWTVQKGLHVFLIAEIMYSCLAWAQSVK